MTANEGHRGIDGATRELDLPFLRTGGEMGRRVRTFDWSQSPLGAPETWPQSLRTAVGIVLGAASPLAVYWGPDLILLYNDAWRTLIGDKHPAALGRPACEVFAEIWGTIGPMFEQAMSGRGGAAAHEQLLPLDRRGTTEDAWFDYSFNPIPCADGSIGGVLNVAAEATERRRARESQRESETRYRTLFKSIDEGFCVVEVLFDAGGKAIDYRFLEVNAAFEEQTGLRDAAGKRMRELEPRHEEHWFETYGRIALSGRPERFVNVAKYLGDRVYDVYAFRIGRPEERRVAVLFKDIAERQRAEKALRQSEERFRALVTATSHVIYRMNPDWSKMRQLDGQDFLADTDEPSDTWLQKYILPEDQPRVLSVIDEAIRTKSLFELEHRVLRADGTVGWTFLRAVPMLDHGGEITEWFGTASDITERKRTEEALREAEQSYRELVQHAPAGIYELDFRQKRLVSVNEAMCQILGYSRKEILAMDPFDILDGSGRDLFRTRIAEWLGGKKPDNNVEFRIKTREGRFIDAILNVAFTTDENEQPLGATVVAHDITARKQAEDALRASEERFRSSVENLMDAFAIYSSVRDEDGRIVDFRVEYANEAACQLTNRKRENYIGRTVLELYPNLCQTPIFDWYVEAVETGKHIAKEDFAFDTTLHGRSGVRYYDCRITRLGDGFTAAWHDVTERKQAHDVLEERVKERTEELRNAYDELQASHAALFQAERLTIAGKLAATVAHEINNPLQSVVGCLGLAQGALASGKDPAAYLEIAHQEVRRTVRFVSQLRSLGRPIQEGSPEPTDLNRLIDDVLALNKKLFQGHEVEVFWEPGAGLPLLMAVPDAIRQLFLNLVLNAVDAMPEGGQLRLSTARTGSPAGVQAVVADDGKGIAPGDLPHLFEAFYSTKPEGLGVGLYVSQSIVQQHGGRIQVESEPDVGTTFSVWLPA